MGFCFAIHKRGRRFNDTHFNSVNFRECQIFTSRPLRINVFVFVYLCVFMCVNSVCVYVCMCVCMCVYMGKFKNNWGCGQKSILGSVTSTDNDPKVKILNFMMLKTVRRNSDRFRSYSGF